MMSNWYTEYTRANPNTQPPPSPPIPQPASVAPQVVERKTSGRQDTEARSRGILERAKFWLENTIKVFDELSCTSEECLKCALEGFDLSVVEYPYVGGTKGESYLGILPKGILEEVYQLEIHQS
ncbi:Protein MCM10 [Gossypium australe]|uniref:Protein MCM10 n=1 Tax=Gossypium australe TaxID=47621 RepID=A0A5B6VN41_9ROSI|nr:Protein MCM10 [Gossypium australe]